MRRSSISISVALDFFHFFGELYYFFKVYQVNRRLAPSEELPSG